MVEENLVGWVASACRGEADALAITVQGENADAIVDGDKRVENRNYNLQCFAFIHKGKAKTPEKWKKVLEARPNRGAFAPRGMIVGVAQFGGKVPCIDRACFKPWVDDAAKAPNRIKRVFKFKQPVPHRGQLGLWHVSEDALSAIAEQMAPIAEQMAPIAEQMAPQLDAPPAAALVRAAELGLRPRAAARA